MPIEPFSIDIHDDVLSDLRARIRGTRWPDQVSGLSWEQGTELGYLRETLAYWADGFDWPAAQRELNSFEHVRVDLGDATVHCVHARAKGGGGIPLILTHGWPSSFVEYLALVPLLTDPADGPAFDLVIPSLPGYGFSPRPDRTGINYRAVAGLWHRLMKELGYERYGVGGGDFGAGVAVLMALDDPGPVLGVHLTNMDIYPYLGPGSRPLSPAEEAYLAQQRAWDAVERGYSGIQSTRPQTVGYGLTDSPAGLAAWIGEKWRSWTGSEVSRDFLLTVLTIYWATRSITSSMRDYYDNRWSAVEIGPTDYVRVPTGLAVFSHERVPEGEPPREWAERLHNVRRWTPMPRGGHFAPVEEPDLVARDIAAFFAELLG
jgi:pimeloyl-ACP methyl ester carboxylesterase